MNSAILLVGLCLGTGPAGPRPGPGSAPPPPSRSRSPRSDARLLARHAADPSGFNPHFGAADPASHSPRFLTRPDAESQAAAQRANVEKTRAWADAIGTARAAMAVQVQVSY